MSWVDQAKQEVAKTRQLVQALHQVLRATSTNAPQIAMILENLYLQQQNLNRYIDALNQYIENQSSKQQLKQQVAQNTKKLSSTLQTLQIFKDKITYLLQQYPYTSPYGVRDEYWPVVTTYASDSQSIDLSHIDPIQAVALQHAREEASETTSPNHSEPSTTTNTESRFSATNVSSQHLDSFPQATVPLFDLLHIAKNNNLYRSSTQIWIPPQPPPADQAVLYLSIEQLLDRARSLQ